ncbi:MAG: hypothetical protein Kow0092_03820 [Deferrisomatales bacterium]
MARDAKRAQRQAQKRRQRERRVREHKARQRTLAQGRGNRNWVAECGDWPVEECVISKGWQERGLAHILLARRTPEGTLLVGGYYVDTLCVGLKDTAVLPNLDPGEYQERIKPQIFNDPVEFEPCSPEVARAVVEGAVEFAARYGFRPAKRWEESRRVFDGVEARAEGLAFGKGGKPCLVLRNDPAERAARARLERTAGPGNYEVVEGAGGE